MEGLKWKGKSVSGPILAKKFQKRPKKSENLEKGPRILTIPEKALMENFLTTKSAHLTTKSVPR